MTKRLRFAPSPTGNIHIGNTRIALMNYLISLQSKDSEFILRIDDTDQERSKQEYIDNIKNDLKWLGFKVDSTFNQSARLELYENALKTLQEQGLAYACYETTEELEYKKKRLLARGKPPIYDREMLNLTEQKRSEYEKEGRKPYFRFKIQPEKITWEDKAKGKIEFDGKNISDPVLIRENGSFLYMLPSVVDDIDYNITDVVRGEDHIANTAIQIQMIKALKGNIPNFAHISFITNDTGQGLSKRFNDLSIVKLRESGISPSAILSYLFALGTSESGKVYDNIEEIAKDFAIENYGKGSVKFSLDKLKKINSHIAQNLTFEEALKHIPQNIEENKKQDFWNTVKDNIENIQELSFWQNILFEDISYNIENKKVAQAILNHLPENIDNNTWKDLTNNVKNETGLKGKELFIAIRQAVTSLNYGPEISKIAILMGKKQIENRIKQNI